MSRSWGRKIRPCSCWVRHGFSHFFSPFSSASLSSSLTQSSSLLLSWRFRTKVWRSCCRPSPGMPTHSQLSLLSSHVMHRDDPLPISKSSYLQNTWLRHLCKNGSLWDACSLFAVMEKDIFSWNIMMSAYVGIEQSDATFCLFSQMLNEGTVPNKFIYATILSACAAHEEVGPGMRIHARIESNRDGFSSDPVVQTALVNMYGRFGDLRTACRIFEGDPGKDVVLWNSILTAYAQHGQGKSSWQLYLHMQQMGVLQNKVTYIIMLSACSNEAVLKEGKKLHVWVTATGLEHDIVVGTALINMYGKCYSLETMRNIFHGMLRRDLIVWNAMVSGHTLNKKYEDVFYYFDQMQQEGEMPNEATCTSILDACTGSKSIVKGKFIHARIAGMDLGMESFARAALVNMYGKCGSHYNALDLFNESKDHRDAILWNTMISMYAMHGMNRKSMDLYHQMVEKGIVADRVTFISILSLLTREADLDEGRRVHIQATHFGLDLDTSVGNVLVSMYGQFGNLPDALAIFDKLSCHDAVTFVNIITACTTHTALAEGKRIHSLIEGTKVERNVVLRNALVNMYSKCGSLVDAQKWFAKMPEQNVVSWSIIIAAYAQHGEGKRAFCLFAEMCRRCILPDNVTLVSLLVACSHAGDLKEAHDFLLFICDEFTTPALDHINCMLDLLGRSGSLSFAEHLVNCMPFLPNSLSWSMLVCACHIYGDLDHGYLAAEYGFELDPNDSTIYVLLSNMYGTSGKEP